MTDIKVVIGANWGDEGKGLMTDYFCNQAKEQNKTCIVVCSNGGSQRGHTVETSNGIRHIFHHFGSGTLVGVPTYLSEEYIVNPMVFMKEWHELYGLGYLPAIYINKNCKISTPFDMIANQILEENRGENRHGSCGLGIWETIKRYNSGINGNINTWKDNEMCMRFLLSLIRDTWLREELRDCIISDEWKSIIEDRNMVEHYIRDFKEMISHCIIVDSDDFLADYDYVVFENGQGLLLDQNIQGYGEHTTPSNTGFKNPSEIINRVFGSSVNVEVCYVTRSYLTRHGAGRFDEECGMNNINPDIIDLTNQPNPHQGAIRYGKYDLRGFLKLVTRCVDDTINNFNGKYTVRPSIAITHLNEYDPKVHSEYVKYRSYGKTRDDIRVR